MDKSAIPGACRPESGAAPLPRFAAPSAKILVVDDLAANIRFLKELMSPCGAKTYAALSGARAIEMMQKERYDIVFMDMMMPEMDGLETIARMRELGAGGIDGANASGMTAERFRQAPVVLVSASEIDAQDEAIAPLGVSGCLSKPIDAAKLFGILERLLPREKIIPA